MMTRNPTFFNAVVSQYHLNVSALDKTNHFLSFWQGGVMRYNKSLLYLIMVLIPVILLNFSLQGCGAGGGGSGGDSSPPV